MSTDNETTEPVQPVADVVPASSVFSQAPPDAPKPTASVVANAADDAEEDEREDVPAKPAAPAPGTPVDADGVPFDPAKHQSGKAGPRKRADGRWVPKGGRGKKAAPKPANQGQSYLAPERKAPAAADTKAADQTTTPVEGEDDEQDDLITPAEAEATGEALTAATFGVAAATLGPVWEPTEAEAKVWKGYWARVSEATGLRLPLFLEGIVHAITSCARRLKSPDPDTRWGRFVAWAKGQDVGG